MIEIGARHWSLALGAALVAHAGLLVLVHEPASSSAEPARFGGIAISLGPAGSKPSSLSASAAKPANTRTVAPEEVLSESPAVVTAASMPEAGPLTTALADQVRAVPVGRARIVLPESIETASAVTLRRPAETRTVAPEEISSDPPVDVAAASMPEAGPLTTALADQVRAVPAERALIAPPESIETASAVTLHRPAETRTVAPEEISSEPPVDVAAASMPEAGPLTTVLAEAVRSVPAERARMVHAESIETASAVPIARQVQLLTAVAEFEASDANPEEQQVIRKVTYTRTVTPQPLAELVHTRPREEVTARRFVVPPTPRRQPEPPTRPASTRLQTKPASAPMLTDTAHPRPGPAAVKNDRPIMEQAATRAPTMSSAGGRIGALARNDAGSGEYASYGGAPGAAAGYYTRLQAWLEKHKRYPRRARLRGEQGVVLLRFVVTRRGEVSAFGIEKSSGHSRLDEEARKMIQRAQPLPKMPPEMRERRVELLVPVRFFLQ